MTVSLDSVEIAYCPTVRRPLLGRSSTLRSLVRGIMFFSHIELISNIQRHKGGCPFVTSIGATEVLPGKKVTDPESACATVIFSGGGFSNHFKIPEYQKSAVNSFLKNHPPPFPTNIWNATGSRAFPDISANGCVPHWYTENAG